MNRLLLCLISWIVIGIYLSEPLFAQQEKSKKSKKTEKDTLAVSEIESKASDALKFQAILDRQEEQTKIQNNMTYFSMVRAVSQSTFPRQVILKILIALKTQPYLESVEAALDRLETEVTQGLDLSSSEHLDDLRFEVILRSLEIVHSYGSVKNLDVLNLEKILEARLMGDRRWSVILHPLFEKIKFVLPSRPSHPRSYVEAKGLVEKAVLDEVVKKPLRFQENNFGILNLESSKSPEVKLNEDGTIPVDLKWGKDISPLKYVSDRYSKLKEILHQKIVGHEELIERLLDIEWNNLLYPGARKNPEVLLLTGILNQGEREVIETFVEVLHAGKKTGSRDRSFTVYPKTDRHEVWELLSSSSGYKDSENITDFMRFLAANSCGRYSIESEKQTKVQQVNGKAPTEKISENFDWKQGSYQGDCPDRAFLIVPNFHLWSRSAKDEFLLEFVNNAGYFKINNPNLGVKGMHVPVNLMITSGEGENLLTSKNTDGSRYGSPLNEEQVLAKWKKNFEDKDRIKQLMRSANRVDSNGKDPLGTSQQLIDSFSPESIFLMKPVGSELLRKKIALKLKNHYSEITKLNASYLREAKFEISEALIKFIQEHQYRPEEGLTALESKLVRFVVAPFNNGLRNGIVQLHQGVIPEFTFDIQKNEDGTASLVVNQKRYDKVVLPIAATLADKIKEPITDQEIESLLSLEKRLSNHVIGREYELAQISRALVAQAAKDKVRIDPKNPQFNASTFMLLGLSSTGKTETAKAVARERFGTEQALKVIDFSQVRTMHDLKVKILGVPGAPSEFMLHYDRTDGEALFVFDELANCPLEVLKGLYDILREAEVTTFADGRPRNMKSVMILITGNVGEKDYKQIPRHVPELVQMLAWQEVNKKAQSDAEHRRQLLEEYFSEALINRIGENRIFFYGPLDFAGLRKLSILKLKQAFGRLSGKIEGLRSWNFQFSAYEDLEQLIEDIEADGFVLREQGASLDRFVKDEFEEKLRHLLTINKINVGANVNISANRNGRGSHVRIVEKARGDDHHDKEILSYKIEVEGRAEPLYLEMKRKVRAKPVPKKEEELDLTAWHEVGHLVVAEVFMHDLQEGSYISILPGVAKIGGSWIYYAGVATHKNILKVSESRETLIREIAGLVAGKVAQELVTQGGRTDSGKSNDYQRITEDALELILKSGHSSVLGGFAFPENQSVFDVLKTLPEAKQIAVMEEVKDWIKEAEAYAQVALLSNWKLCQALANELVAKGKVERAQILKFYKREGVKREGNIDWNLPLNAYLDAHAAQHPEWREKELPKTGIQLRARDAKLLPTIEFSKKRVDLSRVAEKTKAAAVKDIELPGALVSSPDISIAAAANRNCEGALKSSWELVSGK